VRREAEIASDDEMSKISENLSGWPSQSRKESTLNCLLIETRGFIYKREIKKRIKKTADLLEEGKPETAGMKTTAACVEWLTWQGRKDKLMAAFMKRLWAWKVRKISLCKKWDVCTGIAIIYIYFGELFEDGNRLISFVCKLRK